MGKKSKRRQPAAATVAGQVTAKLKIGDKIKLKGLNAAQYNGKIGVIKSLPKAGEKDGRYGILIDGTDAPVAIRQSNIVIVASRQSTEELRRERENSVAGYVYEGRSGQANADQLQMMRMMMSMMSVEQQMEVFGRKLDPMPDFRREFISGRGFPLGVDKAWGDNYLRTSFEQSSACPHSFEMAMKMPAWEPQSFDILKRLGTNDPAKLDWYCKPKSVGSIFRVDDVTRNTAYTKLMRHSFSNNPYKTEVLHAGTTHVAVGFVDLGILFAAFLSSPPEGREGPLHFFGVEMSAYSVAKTLVIWEMLKQTPTATKDRKNHIRSIAQVWFSTTWSKGTSGATKAALQSLSNASKSSSYHPEVKALLDHWLGLGSLPIPKTRSLHATSTTCARSFIGALERKIDRMAMAKYELTGDFALGDTPLCGNSLTYDCPDGTAPLDTDETCFSALDWKELSKLLSPTTTIVDAAEAYVLSNVSKLAEWAINGTVTVELVCAKIEDVVEDVSAARPWTMSWSNVLDYVEQSDFHRMARACSAHGDTIHFGYSMNWTSSVFGTNIIDFQGPERANMRSTLIDETNTAIERSYNMLGWSEYLRLPPPENPINTTSHYCLEQMHYRAWVEHFFDTAKRDGPCSFTNLIHGAFGSPLSPTGASSISFTWTYDPEIRFEEQAIL